MKAIICSPRAMVKHALKWTALAVGDENLMTYTKGQSWYEQPENSHLVSKNASQTEPAKLLVFLLSQEGESIKAPIK